MNMNKITKKKKRGTTSKKTVIEMPEKSNIEMPEKSKTPEPQAPSMRQIIIQTDGTNVQVLKAEVTNLEFQAVLENLLRTFHSSKQ